MTAEEWVDYEISRQERYIDKLSNLEWEEFDKKREQLIAHVAKMQVLSTVKKKLKEAELTEKN